MKWTDLPSIALLTATLLLSTGCEKSELCYDHSHVVDLKVNFDWSEAPDASPTSVSLYLFPRSGGETIRYELTEHDGGTVRVEKGEYDAICVNSDTYNIVVEGTESFSTCHITTAETSLKSSQRIAGSRSDELRMLEPDPIWHGVLTSINLTDERADNEITMTPTEATETYRVNISDVENLNHTVSVSAELTGMAAGIQGSTGALSERCVTLPFDLSISRDKTSLTGEIRTFGHCPADITGHSLTLHVVLDDGTEWIYDCDVTRQLDYARSTDNLLEIEGLPIPTPAGSGDDEGGSAFQPDVSEWVEIVVPIDMGGNR